MNLPLEAIGLLGTAAAVVGVILNNHKLRICFIVFLLSNSIALGIHIYARIWAMVLRDVIFLYLAWSGWRRWGRKGTGK